MDRSLGVKLRRPFLFISTMAGDRWGASEELWARSALFLVGQGLPVAASVQGWPQPDCRIIELVRAGVDLRPRQASVVARAWRRISGKDHIVLEIERSFRRCSPRLVLISSGSSEPPVDLVEFCVARGWSFATVDHAQMVSVWPSDAVAARLRKALPSARRLFFVSEANRALAERQFGYELDNAEIIRNPINLNAKSPLPWPSDPVTEELRMACVGRLKPGIKGQDILLDALATSSWAERNWRLTLYGDGMNRDLLERLARRLKLDGRVFFAGHVAVENIWRENHVLVLPSRTECLPLTIVEAMHCGRPVVATNVGGVSEVVNDGVNGFLAEAAAVKCLDEALERMWSARGRLKKMGRSAAASIRELIPADPIAIFAERLKNIADPAFD